MRLLSPLSAFLLILISSCTSIQPTDPYATVRRSATPASAGYTYSPPRSRPDTPEGALTLEQCVEVALAGNPELAATSWDVSAAGSRLAQAQAARWPTLSAEGGYNRHLDPQRLIQTRYNSEPGYFDTDIYRGDLIIKMPVFTGGRIVNEIAAADLFRRADESRLARTREELLFNVSSVFYSILGQRKVIESLEFSIKAMEEHLKQVNDLLAVQKAARVDLLRTEVRLSDLRQNLVKEQNVLAVQKRILANFLGLDYDTDQFMIEGKLTFEDLIYHADQLIPNAMESRPDYLAARARLEAQARRVDIAKAGRWPSVSIQGNYGLRATGNTGEDGDCDDVGALGVLVTVPLFEGGRVKGKVNEEWAALAAARERLRKLELQVRQDVETAVLDTRSSSERVKALDKAIEQARESLRIEREKYDLGVGSMTDVLDAQSALLQSETGYYRALADFRTAIARLDFATGGRRL